MVLRCRPVAIHGRPCQVGKTAGFRVAALLALDAQGHGESEGTVVRQHGLFLDGQADILSELGIGGLDDQRFLYFLKRLHEHFRRKGHVRRASPIFPHRLQPKRHLKWTADRKRSGPLPSAWHPGLPVRWLFQAGLGICPSYGTVMVKNLLYSFWSATFQRDSMRKPAAASGSPRIRRRIWRPAPHPRRP